MQLLHTAGELVRASNAPLKCILRASFARWHLQQRNSRCHAHNHRMQQQGREMRSRGNSDRVLAGAEQDVDSWRDRLAWLRRINRSATANQSRFPQLRVQTGISEFAEPIVATAGTIGFWTWFSDDMESIMDAYMYTWGRQQSTAIESRLAWAR